MSSGADVLSQSSSSGDVNSVEMSPVTESVTLDGKVGLYLSTLCGVNHPIDLTSFTPEQAQELMEMLRIKSAELSWSLNHASTTKPDNYIAISQETVDHITTIHNSIDIISKVSNISAYHGPTPTNIPKTPPSHTNLQKKEVVDIRGEMTSTASADGRAAPSGSKRPLDSDVGAQQVENKKKNNRKNKPPNSNTSTDPSTSVGNNSPAPNPSEQNSDSSHNKKKSRPPLFYVVPPAHWPTLLASVLVVAPSYNSKGKGIHFKITVETDQEHRKLQQFFLANSIHFKCYLLEDQKPIKLVIRDFPINTPVDLIKN